MGEHLGPAHSWLELAGVDSSVAIFINGFSNIPATIRVSDFLGSGASPFAILEA
jgi:hypothetical protein